MANKRTNQLIRTRIDSFLAEISGLVKKAALESVHDALGGGAAPRRRRGPGRPRGSGRRGPGRPRKAGRRRAGRPDRTRAAKRIRRSAADLERIAVRVLAHVKSNAGHRLEQVGKALKTDTAILKKPIANLLAARKLTTKGQKRGTMYFAGASRDGASNFRHKARIQRRSKARSTRKAKVSLRGSRKKAARRHAPRVVRPAQARRAKTQRKPSPEARASKARAIADAVALQAAMPPGPQ